MYFIHSYHCVPDDKNLITSNSVFGNKKFVSSLRTKNIIAFQFHPEKSGINGIKVYKEISKIINS
jgi:glutamine amidotransferase